MQSFTYYVYIISNAEKTIYTGVTADLYRRLWQHRDGSGSKFAKKTQRVKTSLVRRNE
ncbi:GIY-YIG nuclease family protein [Candidatus Lucifugimonas marina]|uniref:GIY-YIG nuclease family protein n=1 Tax=Candidatus Lucifugimonas marina TaxID=3038979 RepID=UPI00319D9780